MRATHGIGRHIGAAVTATTVTAVGLVGATATPAGAAGVEASISDEAVIEGNSGAVTMTFDVTLGAAAVGAVEVSYATVDGSAAAGSDYVAESGSVTFAAGELTKPVTIDVNGDTAVEPNEWFFVDITSTDVPVLDGRGNGGITDDDGPPPDFVVDVTGDEPDAAIDGVCARTGGGCTLRAALAESDAAAGTDTIGFAITGTPTIFVNSALAANDTVVIDGTTQPGFTASPVVFLDGSFAPTSPFLFLLRLNGQGSTVRGLAIGSDGSGYALTLAGTGSHTVEGNYLGLNPAGERAQMSGGLYVNSPNNQIGGRTLAARNVISGNAFDGIEMPGSSNVVEGNYIGLDPSGTGFEGNARFGIYVSGSNNRIGGAAAGARNIVTTTGISDIYVGPGGGAGTQIQGNWIGLTSTAQAQPRGGVGILADRANDLVIGGTAAGAGNVVAGKLYGIQVGNGLPTLRTQIVGNLIGTDPSGNAILDVNGNGGGNQYGVWIESDDNVVGPGNVIAGSTIRQVVIGEVRSAARTIVKGNLIGTNAAGGPLGGLGTTFEGIRVSNATATRIGGTTLADRNVISGHSADAVLLISGSSGSIVQGNLIGTTADGTGVLGNGAGIHIEGSTDNTIGGITAGAGNVIANSLTDGVQVRVVSNGGTPPTVRNIIRGNVIRDNGDSANGIGIDLVDGAGVQGVEGLNVNDPGDADTGPNNLQNHPVLSAATTNGSMLELTADLDSEASKIYSIDVYASATCTPTNRGQAERYLGSFSLATGAGGTGTVTTSLTAAVAPGEKLTATATHPTGHTSELSPCATLAAAPSRAVADFDGDGDTDIGVFRPSVGGWYIQGQATVFHGLSGDIPVPGDYNGDGLTDRAVFRPDVGGWYIQGQATVFHGLPGDIPVPADYNGDGTTDVAIYRPSVGGWYINGQPTVFHGLSTDTPVPGDYNGDGITDVAIYRPSVGGWYINGQATVFHGLSTDTPVPGDYDGDGLTDVAVFRGDSGAWLIKDQPTVFLGLSSDTPVPGDYDGNWLTDPAVFRADTGAWYINNQPTTYHGLPGDIPTPKRPTPP